MLTCDELSLRAVGVTLGRLADLERLCWLKHPVDCCNAQYLIFLLDKRNCESDLYYWFVFC